MSVPTDIVLQVFVNRTLILVSQTGKSGSWIEVTREDIPAAFQSMSLSKDDSNPAVDSLSPEESASYQSRTLLGDSSRQTDVIVARSLAAITSSSSTMGSSSTLVALSLLASFAQQESSLQALLAAFTELWQQIEQVKVKL